MKELFKSRQDAKARRGVIYKVDLNLLAKDFCSFVSIRGSDLDRMYKINWIKLY